MYGSKLVTALIIMASIISGCSPAKHSSTSNHIINVDLGADIATLDPQMTEDVQSSRVAYDLFEGLTSFDQANQPIPGLADKWQISPDGKTYTFHLRPGIKFSDGTPITPQDVVFTYQRLADPKTASPYNYLIANLSNGQAVIDGKLPATSLGIKAIGPDMVQINMQYPDSSLVAICSMPDLGIVSAANIKQYGQQWTAHMVTSGAYKLSERVINGYILLSKNPYYYAADKVAYDQIKFFPIVDFNASLSQYKSGTIDITYLLPTDQYSALKAQLPAQVHTVSWETIEYLDYNMHDPKFKDNLKLRQALSMAIDRKTLVQNVLGQQQTPLYSYVTPTIESGRYADVIYPWAKWPRDQQLAVAQELFRQAGYSSRHPLQLAISYNTKDSNKKKALAIAAMWQQAFGANSIQVTSNNQEWKTFLQARHKSDYDLARDGWVADYNDVSSYADLYLCNNPQNNSKACTPGYDSLIAQARTNNDPVLKSTLIHQALAKAMANYAIIPLYQDTYFRLVSPKVKGYTPETNHLDHVLSKWYHY